MRWTLGILRGFQAFRVRVASSFFCSPFLHVCINDLAELKIKPREFDFLAGFYQIIFGKCSRAR